MVGLTYLYQTKYLPEYRLKVLATTDVPDYVDPQILDFSSNSRSGENLEAYNSIVIHYVANPGSSAQANHDYFANPESNVTSHFVVGLDGEIIQCLPLDEESAASNWRNNDTISIEVCHPDDSGKFNDATYESLVKLTKWLVELGNLNPKKDIIRHYDITGKNCPKYYVENPDAWEQFISDVKN
jgi:N-acetylmuramoyl-L-alanine amidase